MSQSFLHFHFIQSKCTQSREISQMDLKSNSGKEWIELVDLNISSTSIIYFRDLAVGIKVYILLIHCNGLICYLRTVCHRSM